VGRDSLRAGRSGDRIPVEAKFSAPVQTGPEAHPDSCTMGTGSFPALRHRRPHFMDRAALSLDTKFPGDDANHSSSL